MAAGLLMTLGPEWIEIMLKHLFDSCSPVTVTFCSHQKQKHECDAQRKAQMLTSKKDITTLHQQLLMLITGLKPSLLPLHTILTSYKFLNSLEQ